MKKILLGDEAYAQGVLDAGLSGCYAYPGTPSTEIMEYVQNSKLAAERGIHREWSSNEKTAMEEALGVSYAGKRAIVCMKHVGLNVAGDGFVNSAVTGTNGGLLVTVADDPSMHSSQNEQDSRFYAQFAMIPCIEPSSQQECYDLAKYAFELSEKNEIPVLIRLTTRLSHSRSNIETADAPSAMNDLHAPNNPRRFVLLPAIAKGNVKKLCEKQADFAKLSEESPFNKLIDGKDTSLGIVATGIAYNYVMEAFGGNCPYPILKISQYPLPKKMLSTLLNKCDKIMVVEEGAPFVESQLRGPLEDPRIMGRLTGHLPRTGELNPYLVAKAFDLKVAEPPAIPDLVKMRPPRLCDGCPHVSTYNALKEAIAKFEDPRVFGDIGCYTLGALPPFQAISSCVDMGASVTMAKGAADAGIHPHDGHPRRRLGERQHHRHDSRQRNDRHDRRPDLHRRGPSRDDLHRPRRQSGPCESHHAAAAEARRKRRDHRGGTEIRRPVGHRLPPRMHPDAPPEKIGVARPSRPCQGRDALATSSSEITSYIYKV